MPFLLGRVPFLSGVVLRAQVSVQVQPWPCVQRHHVPEQKHLQQPASFKCFASGKSENIRFWWKENSCLFYFIWMMVWNLIQQRHEVCW